MERMREEFELYVSSNHLGMTGKDGNGDYFNPVIGMLWRVWKASRAALCVELPKQWFGGEYDDEVMKAGEVIESLEKAVVSHK